MPEYVLAFVIAAGVALALTPGVIFLAAKTGAMDAPDARKVHKKPIPRIGGLGIYAAFMVAILGIMQFIEVEPEVLFEVTGLLVGGEPAGQGQIGGADYCSGRACHCLRCAH